MTPDQIIQIVIYLLPLVPMGFLIQQFNSHRKVIEDKLIPVQQQAHVEAIVGEVVGAVEQTCASLIGPQKRYEAVRMATQLLNEKGIHVSQAMLETLIENAVFQIHQTSNPTQTGVIKALTAASNIVLNSPPAPPAAN